MGDLTTTNILARLRDPKAAGQDKWMAFCPCHNDGATQGRRSLSVKDEGGKVLLYCFAGCKYEDIMDALGLKPEINAHKPKRVIVATYDYRDADGRVRYQAVRYHPKSFVQCQLNEAGGKVWNMKGVEPLPFRLPESLAAIAKGEPVFITEGEKDVLNLAAIGITATCNHGGAGKWKPALSEHFPSGAEVAILPDNDEPGRQHAEKVAQELQAQGCRVRIVNLPNLPEKGDVSDWMAAGGTKEQLYELAAMTDTWEPELAPLAGSRVTMVCMADVAPEPVNYLWHPYIPLGKLTLLEGDPGGGKTWLALAIAAATTAGCRFPTQDGKPGQWRETASVIYISGEDGTADTLRPRLDAVEADVSKVFAITGAVDEEGKSVQWTMEKIAELEVAIIQTSAQLVIIDPVQAFLGAEVDMHRANEVRPKLAALAALADRQRCAVVIIRHLTKAGASKAIYRGMGSIDFTAAARSVLLVGQDSQDGNNRAMVHIKSSLAPAGPSQRYELTSEGFRWAGVSSLTAADVLGMEATKEDRSALEDAVEWLRDFLADGPKENPEIDKVARQQDIKPKTLRTAKERLLEAGEVRRFKKVGVFNGPWLWALVNPENDPEDELDPNPSKDLEGQDHNILETHIYQGLDRGVELDPRVKFGQQELDPRVKFVAPPEANGQKGSTDLTKLTLERSREQGQVRERGAQE